MTDVAVSVALTATAVALVYAHGAADPAHGWRLERQARVSLRLALAAVLAAIFVMVVAP